LREIAHCTLPASLGNILNITLAPGVKFTPASTQRFGTISTSCGLCGKTSIEFIRQRFPAIDHSNPLQIQEATLLGLPARLRMAQGNFARTGGIHAAGIFDFDGNLLVVREDIGRHNAVDKAIGRAFLDGLLPLSRHILLVSGRSSLEIVQKALAGGIPIVAAVSAPSSLAVNFARECGQTLIGFLRPPTFNVYSHIERIAFDG
jgi:FdhD protein